MVGVFVLVLQQVEGAVLVPRVMKNAVGLTPFSIILAVLIGGVLMGPLGSLLAIPVAAAVQVLIQGLLRTYDEDMALREEEGSMATEDVPNRRVQHSPTGGSE
jgi:predicted PurR-regulated permease PerM